ncbi:MAG: hypothetical protein QNJ30_25000 [Kiloniellales bacterium]|nr:hypothetical protein [Kiloniellales bacterium]
MSFIKYFIYRIGSTCFWLGVIFPPATLAITIYEATFFLSATEVEARVLEVERLCTLTWKSGGKSSETSDPMDCTAAAEIKAANPKRAYRTREHVRTHLLFTDPEGKGRRIWTEISRYQGRKLQPGDSLPLLIDPEDPSDYRRTPELSDLIIPGTLFGGGIALAFVGWLLKGLGRGGRLPPPIWTWFRRRAT